MRQQEDRDLIELCYASVAEPQHYQVLTENLCRRIGADAADIVLEDVATKSCLTLATMGFDEAFLESYDTEYLGKNPWFEELAALGAGRSHSDEATSPVLRRSAYVNEWVKPQGLEHSLGAVVEHTSTRNGWIGFSRTKGSRPYTGREQVFLDRLLPHLTRSIQLFCELDKVESRADALSGAIGALPVPVMILNDRGAVVEMNTEAEEFLSGQSELRLADSGHIIAMNGRTHAKIGAAVHSALAALDQPDASIPAPVVVRDTRAGKGCTLQVTHLRSRGGSRGAVITLQPL